MIAQRSRLENQRLSRLKMAGKSFRLDYQAGFTLVSMIFVLICTSLALVTGWSLMEGSSSNFGFQEEQALWIAQGGINAAVKYLEALPLINDLDWNHNWPNLSGNIAGGSFVVSFTYYDRDHITLKSTGTYGDCVRCVTRGITRIAQGATYVYYYGGNAGGARIQGASRLEGAATYTNAPIWSNTIYTRVYCRAGAGVASPVLEAQWIVAAKPVIGNYPTQNMNEPSENLLGVQHYQKKWQELAALLVGVPPGLPALTWTAGTYTIDPNPANNQFGGITGFGTITTPDGGMGDYYLIIQGNVFGSLVIAPRAGARINLVISGNWAGGAGIQDTPATPNTPTYIYVGGTLSHEWYAPITADCLRILVHRVQFNSGRPPPTLSQHFPGTGELTYYVSSVVLPDTTVEAGRCDSVRDGTPPVEVKANIILDGSTANDWSAAHSIWGIVYCYGNSTVYPNNAFAVRGSVIADNPASVCWSRPGGSGGQILEDPNYWIEPAGYMPTALGLNPVGTGRFSMWREIRP